MPNSKNLLPAFFLAMTALPAHAGVTVTSTEPDRFTDAGDRSNDPRKVMKALEAHFVKLGAGLAPGVEVAIEVTDLDRAGRPRMNLQTEIRVMSGKADVPCITFQYTVQAAGQQTSSARERLCDLDYLRPLGFRADEHDPLVYEKRMITEWWERRFGKAPVAR